ncbi:MAG: hypothetical protein CL912_23015 [Deltaproteobacteria bacterium]|nr:hypothetical protein [Deltaproteobacteria bacterium]
MPVIPLFESQEYNTILSPKFLACPDDNNSKSRERRMETSLSALHNSLLLSESTLAVDDLASLSLL